MAALLREVIGDVLRRARTSQGRTLREVSDSARVSLGYLSEVERGRKEASSELLTAICGALDVPLSEVLTDAGQQLAARGARRGVRERGQHRREPPKSSSLPSCRWRSPEPVRRMAAEQINWAPRARSPALPTSTRRRKQLMANPFVKAWKYLMALFSSKVDEYADPKVQIQQAIEEAQRQHQALTQQAAQVIGNQRQLEMRLNRQLADIEKLQVNVRQAVTLADQATASGDAAKATEYNNAAEAFAAQLVTAEQSVEDLKGLHDQALQAAGQAKKAVEQNAMVLQQKIAERTKLLSQLEQAKMQEQVSASLRSMSELAAPGNTPSLDQVREKIERRYANALGAAELAQNSVQGRMLEVQQASVQMAGHSRLEQIRASMRGRRAAGRWYRPASTPTPAAPVAEPAPQNPVSSAVGHVGGGGETRGQKRISLAAAAEHRHRQRIRRPGRRTGSGGRPTRGPGCCASDAGRCGWACFRLSRACSGRW